METSKRDKIRKILADNIHQEESNIATRPKNNIIRLKDYFKQNQFVYSLAMSLVFPIRYNFYYSKIIFKFLSKDDIILNLGSGNKIIDKSIINVDLFQYENVDIPGDIESLPIKDNCVNGIINEVTLEHLKNPEKALGEMNRILKVGGYLCISVPFLFFYHESPDDYHRWTKSGITKLLKENNFVIIEFENLGGPIGSFNLMIAQILAIIFSFNIKIVYHILSYLFLLIFSPLQILDFIFSKYSMASNASSIFLIIAKKNKLCRRTLNL